MSNCATQRKGVELVGDAQTLKLEGGVNRHKDVVALGSHRARGSLGQAHQYEAKFQGVVDAGLDHLAHHLVLGLFAFSLKLFGGKVAVLNRLLHQLKRHRDERPIAVVQRVESIDASDGASTAVVKVPAHQLTLIGPDFFLNRVVKDQHAVIMLNRPDGRLDLTVDLTCCHRSLQVYSRADKNRVIWSWLTSPSTIADKPVAVAAPNVLNK